jgi:hypothetical protein
MGYIRRGIRRQTGSRRTRNSARKRSPRRSPSAARPSTGTWTPATNTSTHATGAEITCRRTQESKQRSPGTDSSPLHDHVSKQDRTALTRNNIGTHKEIIGAQARVPSRRQQRRRIDLSVVERSGIAGTLTLSSTVVGRRLRWGSGLCQGHGGPCRRCWRRGPSRLRSRR